MSTETINYLEQTRAIPFSNTFLFLRRSSQKKEPAPAEKAAVNGLAVKVENTSITAKEAESPVQIEVTEHVEDDGETEVKEKITTTQNGGEIEEKKEVTKTTKTTTPGGGKITTQTKETKTKKTFTGESRDLDSGKINMND